MLKEKRFKRTFMFKKKGLKMHFYCKTSQNTYIEKGLKIKYEGVFSILTEIPGSRYNFS